MSWVMVALTDNNFVSWNRPGSYSPQEIVLAAKSRRLARHAVNVGMGLLPIAVVTPFLSSKSPTLPPTINSPPPVKNFLPHQPPANPHSGSNSRLFVSDPRPSAATQSRIFPYNARVNRACNIPLHRDEEPDLEPALEYASTAPPLKPHAVPVTQFRLFACASCCNKRFLKIHRGPRAV